MPRKNFFIGDHETSWRYIPVIRLMVGWVFILAGIRKFMEPAEMGVGRFAEMGLPAPGFLAPMVGSIEVICGMFVLFGIFTRLMAVPLAIVMLFALGLTKIPMLMEGEGMIEFLHAARLDVSMLLGSVYLIASGSGPYSLDYQFSREPGG